MTSFEAVEKQNGFSICIFFGNGNVQNFYPVTKEIVDQITDFLMN